jgi:hypothetical protein
MTLRSPSLIALITGFLLLGSLWSTCDLSDTPAEAILRRTVPGGDAVPSLSRSTTSEQSIQFTWDFVTQLTPTAYAAWLQEHLRDFEWIPGDESQLRLSKPVGGDA